MLVKDQVDAFKILINVKLITKYYFLHNARLRGWQRITLNPNTTAATTAAQWDWKRHALTVPLEAFVMWPATLAIKLTFGLCP
ncbi:hypothetical protein C1Y48_20810 [Vibrio cholerae]|uniref:Uncharacterized protein n=1 Tax=Vibrio cholerae TaxID=666 RepID=A0A7Z7VJI1_VIBCL|nr:hypothetical protein C1Y48_20810 [Vibrio cholerae]TBM34604.1 hypothetical protein EYB64_21650 [Vibrio cholerae]